MKQYVILVVVLISNLSFTQESNYNAQDISISKWIDGTLLVPNNIENPKLAIIIAGSGPTNRDGNQNFMKNNALKKLAEGLTKENIATFRYDKRVVKQIRQGNVDNNILFEDFVSDATDVINYFKKQGNFSETYIIGHSQGSLVGMLAAKGKADGFISLAGAGQNIGDVIVEQVSKTGPMFKTDTERIVASLKEGRLVSDYPSALGSLFSKDLQPFMISWMSYSPTEEIKTLDMPVLIINGTKDLQVSESEAQLLSEAKEKSKLKIIKNMNHVLFIIEGGDLENSKSYNESSRVISSELIDSISKFIKG